MHVSGFLRLLDVDCACDDVDGNNLANLLVALADGITRPDVRLLLLKGITVRRNLAHHFEQLRRILTRNSRSLVQEVFVSQVLQTEILPPVGFDLSAVPVQQIGKQPGAAWSSVSQFRLCRYVRGSGPRQARHCAAGVRSPPPLARRPTEPDRVRLCPACLQLKSLQVPTSHVTNGSKNSHLAL